MTQEKQVKEQLKIAKREAGLRDSLNRLLNNKDFKNLFQDEYFEKEPVRITMLRANVQLQDPKIQAQMLNDFMAIGALDQFFKTIMQRGQLADKTIQMCQEYLDNPEDYKDEEEVEI